MYFNDVTRFSKLRQITADSVFRNVDSLTKIRCQNLIMKVDLAKDKLLSFLFQHKLIVGWSIESKVVFPKTCKKMQRFFKIPAKTFTNP